MGNLFQSMFTYLSDALAAIIAVYANVVSWISGPLRVGVTIYIILLGFAILRGAVEYPFREFVYRGMKLAALVFAVTTLYGASAGLFAMDGLPRDVAQAVGGSNVDGLGDFFDQIVKGAARTVDKITEIQDARTAAAGKNLIGLPNNIIEIFFTGIYCLVLMVMAIVSAALGFTICAFALFALALLAAVGPIFVAALLFDSTRAFFFAWLGDQLPNARGLRALTDDLHPQHRRRFHEPSLRGRYQHRRDRDPSHRILRPRVLFLPPDTRPRRWAGWGWRILGDTVRKRINREHRPYCWPGFLLCPRQNRQPAVWAGARISRLAIRRHPLQQQLIGDPA